MADSVHRPTTIFDLDDHVLREVFEHMGDFDLTVIADVCTTFKVNAEAVFRSRYKSMTYTFLLQDGERICPMHQGDLPRLRSLLRNFGASISFFRISLADEHQNHSHEAMELINQYCGTTLKVLFLHHVWLTSSLIAMLRSLFSRLQELYFCHCRWQSTSWAAVTQMFSSCSELNSLWIESPQNFDGESFDFQLRIKMPKLTLFAVEDCKGIKKKSIEKFLKMNRQLQTIVISDCEKITNRILPSIAKYTPKLERISHVNNVITSDFVENVKSLKRLSVLKSIGIDCKFQLISSFIGELGAAGIPLENLKLFNFISDQELITGLVSFKKLKELHMFGAYKMKPVEIVEIVSNLSELSDLILYAPLLRVNDLVEIIRCAPKLGELVYLTHPHHESTIDAELYTTILAVVMERTEKSQLHITLSAGQKLDVSDEVLQASQEFLQIDIKLE